jgi:GNAT superfamily N-acetyltransferase
VPQEGRRLHAADGPDGRAVRQWTLAKPRYLSDRPFRTPTLRSGPARILAFGGHKMESPVRFDVRPYAPCHRQMIEDIAYRTGFMGESPEAFWLHRKSWAAIWIAPYLEGEPESTCVATMDGNVVGYLTGCVNTECFKGPDAVMMRKVMRYGLLYRPGVAGFLWRAMLDQARDRWRGHKAIGGELHDARWPSHVHMNLLAEARGRGLGRALIECWFTRLREAGSPGCHLSVIQENQRGVSFFAAMGFEPHGTPTPIPGMRGRAGERLHQLTMVRVAP